MAKYLDQTGLKYFWGKIKAKMPGPIQAYPVGSIYMSISSNFNPNTSFGGTWSKIAEGQCLIQAGSAYTLGSTGGNKKETINFDNGWANIGFLDSAAQVVSLRRNLKKYPTQASENCAYLQWQGIVTGNFQPVSLGGTQEVSLMQPYLAVNIWKRTA